MELRRPCRRSLDDASVILGYEKSDCTYLPIKLWRRSDPEVRICLVESIYMSVNELQSRKMWYTIHEFAGISRRRHLRLPNSSMRLQRLLIICGRCSRVSPGQLPSRTLQPKAMIDATFRTSQHWPSGNRRAGLPMPLCKYASNCMLLKSSKKTFDSMLWACGPSLIGSLLLCPPTGVLMAVRLAEFFSIMPYDQRTIIA